MPRDVFFTKGQRVMGRRKKTLRFAWASEGQAHSRVFRYLEALETSTAIHREYGRIRCEQAHWQLGVCATISHEASLHTVAGRRKRPVLQKTKELVTTSSAGGRRARNHVLKVATSRRPDQGRLKPPEKKFVAWLRRGMGRPMERPQSITVEEGFGGIPEKQVHNRIDREVFCQMIPPESRKPGGSLERFSGARECVRRPKNASFRAGQ